MTEEFPVGAEVDEPEIEDVKRVLKNALLNQEDSRQELQELLDKHPSLAALKGDAARRAENSLLRMATGGNILGEESTRVHLAWLRASLLQPGDGALEQLLVQRIVLSWLAVTAAEETRADRIHKGCDSRAVALGDGHVSRLNGDFLKACRSLAQVRRLLRPVMVAQLNVAGMQQINIGTGVTEGTRDNGRTEEQLGLEHYVDAEAEGSQAG